MRLAITGTHRVGKTTLAEKLAETLTGYIIKPEPFYELEESGRVFSEIPTVDDFLEQFTYSIRQAYTKEDNLIFDRSPIDLLTYIHVLDKARNIQTLYHEVSEAIKHIDMLIFVPIETPDIIECAASDMPSLRIQVNDILQEWIGDFDMEVIEVKGTLRSRAEQVLSRINDKGWV